MEVGEYIRTKNGEIGKIKKIFPDIINKKYINTEYFTTDEEQIIKHSKDIIDLIEAGDIVNGEEIEDCKTINNKKIAISETCFTNKDIETILTHEMYEQNCYEVGED